MNESTEIENQNLISDLEFDTLAEDTAEVSLEEKSIVASTTPSILSKPREKIKVEKNPAIPFYAVIGISCRESLLGLLRSLKWTAKVCWLYLINHPSHAILIILLGVAISILLETGTQLYNQALAGRISDITIEKITSGSRFGRQYSPKAVAQSGSQVFLNVGAPEWMQKEGARAVLASARSYGLPLHHQAALLATVDIESGFNPLAKAPTTTACGLFQFVKRTGEMYGMNQSNCMDPKINSNAGIRHYIDNFQNRIEAEVSKLSETEKLFKTFELSYYLHHDGPNSSNPSKELKAIVLDGTAFLFHVYDILKEAEEKELKAPSFWETLAQKTKEKLEPASRLLTKLNA